MKTATMSPPFPTLIQVRNGKLFLDLMITEGNKQKRQDYFNPASVLSPTEYEITFLTSFSIPQDQGGQTR